MEPVLFDTSIYIAPGLPGEESEFLARNIDPETAIWFSAVVLEELYAGADAVGRRKLAQVECDFQKIRRLLMPNRNDWTNTGKILRQIDRKYSYQPTKHSRLTNCTLIAVSAARKGLTVLTYTQRDFPRIAEFCALKWALW
jgi:predicted nucleic acid-binding protein